MNDVAKKCVSCGTTWSSALPKCPFCGGESAAEPPPKAVALLAGMPPRPEEKVPPSPAPGGSGGPAPDPDETPPELPKVEIPPPPAPKPPEPKTEKIEPSPLGPQVPSSTVPFVFSLLGLVACLALPLAVHFEDHRVLGILGPLAAAILSPFAPFAWLAGLRHEQRCGDLNLIPSGLARAGRILGAIATFVLVFNISMLALIAVVLRLSAAP